ncbi:hypothetical protein ACFE04_026183 [Oxalis oulophora]
MLIGAASSLGKIESALHLYNEMLRREHKPKIITYTELMKGHCIKGNMKEAEELFSSIQKSDLLMDNVPLQILIRKYCRIGSLAVMRSNMGEFLARLVRYSVFPLQQGLSDEAWYAALLTPPHVNDNNMFPKSTHETFAQKMYQTFQNHKRFTKPKLSHTDFAIQHYAGEVIINLGHQGKDQTTLQMNIVQD